jgi:hypothetical protein
MSPAATSNAAEVDVEEVLDDFDPKLLPCKGDHHAWKRNHVWDLLDPETLERLQNCRDCGLVRYKLVDLETGEVLTDYRYRNWPKGYKTKGTKKADFSRRLNADSLAQALKTGKVHGLANPKLEEKRQAKEAS